jgi:simple sugar transport system permease protein
MGLIFVAWWYVYHTATGLTLRAVGENPRAAYARGTDPRKIQLVHVILGGLLVGLAGASFSLCTKPGWGRPQGAEGTGWIALAIVIFGGWHPVKVAAGAYFFAFLQVMGIQLQDWFTSVPSQVFQVAPFPLMIFALLFSYMIQRDPRETGREPRLLFRRLFRFLSGAAPTALGKPFEPE